MFVMQQMCVMGKATLIKQHNCITTPKRSFIMIRSGKNCVPIIIVQTFLSNVRVYITNKQTQIHPNWGKTSVKQIKLYSKLVLCLTIAYEMIVT